MKAIEDCPEAMKIMRKYIRVKNNLVSFCGVAGSAALKAKSLQETDRFARLRDELRKSLRIIRLMHYEMEACCIVASGEK